jgi:hypothetical protein
VGKRCRGTSNVAEPNIPYSLFPRGERRGLDLASINAERSPAHCSPRKTLLTRHCRSLMRFFPPPHIPRRRHPPPSSLSFFSSSGSRSSSHFHHRHHLSFLESLRLSSFSHFTIGCSPASSFEERGSPRRGTPVSFCPLPSFSSYSTFSSFSSSSSSSSFSSSSSSSSSYPSLARWKAPRPLAPSRVPSAPTLVCTTTAALERERERERARESKRESKREGARMRACVFVC